jgi:hypothetical protein
MRNRRMVAMLILALSWMASAVRIDARQASSGEQYAGSWTGTYDGAGSGQFEMTLDKGQGGTMAGKVSVKTEGGDYTADLKSVTFEGAKMSARYDFPLDPSAEIIMTATFEGTSGKGTWSMRAKGQTDELAGGTIAVTKK